LQIEICDHIEQINAAEWNALITDNNPFIRHEFLLALENHQCVGKGFGWLPRHIAVYQEDELVAAMPLYEKYNSYGEFVFDNAWANAWQQHGLRYFPKLVSAVPYTPATGQRLLVKPGLEESHYPVLIGILAEAAEKLAVSGFHILFPMYRELEWLKQQSFLIRHDCQFHWHNNDYQCFEDFLAQLSSRKRKNIIRERRTVSEAGVNLKRLNGHQASDNDWQLMAHFYERTFEEKWGTPTLNYGFFREVAEKMPDQVLLVLAEKDDTCIAGSLMYQSDSTLYGRFWGCDETVNHLHFEACYYQGIEYAIENGLKVFEPGAQGEHKVARGFIPTMTRSAHFMRHQQFQSAIEQFIAYEKNNIEAYMQAINQHLPYKKTGAV
jgi:predicted N-acyltransferase